MWKKCGKFQVEILYNFELQMILVPAVLYVKNHCMGVNVIETTLSEPRAIICKRKFQNLGAQGIILQRRKIGNSPNIILCHVIKNGTKTQQKT